MIRTGTIEAIAWIAVMPHDPTPAPLRVDQRLVDAARREDPDR